MNLFTFSMRERNRSNANSIFCSTSSRSSWLGASEVAREKLLNRYRAQRVARAASRNGNQGGGQGQGGGGGFGGGSGGGMGGGGIF